MLSPSTLRPRLYIFQMLELEIIFKHKSVVELKKSINLLVSTAQLAQPASIATRKTLIVKFILLTAFFSNVRPYCNYFCKHNCVHLNRNQEAH